jgi:hypothetical protein
MAGHRVEFLAPAPFVDGRTVQFWTQGGNNSTITAADIFLKHHFGPDGYYRIRYGANNVSVFAIVQEDRDAWNLHGNVAWVGNTLLCCAKVDPALIYNEEAPLSMPVIRFL